MTEKVKTEWNDSNNQKKYGHTFVKKYYTQKINRKKWQKKLRQKEMTQINMVKFNDENK